MTPARRGLLGLLFLVAASCGGGTPEPGVQPGDLTLALFETGPTPGAILFTISGGPITAVTAVHPAQAQVSWYSPAAGTTRVIVTGTLTTGDLLLLHVPDVSAASSYGTPVMNQVADNATFALIATAPYTLVIHK